MTSEGWIHQDEIVGPLVCFKLTKSSFDDTWHEVTDPPPVDVRNYLGELVPCVPTGEKVYHKNREAEVWVPAALLDIYLQDSKRAIEAADTTFVEFS